MKKVKRGGERKDKGEMGKEAHTRAYVHTHSLGLTHTHSRIEPALEMALLSVSHHGGRVCM